MLLRSWFFIQLLNLSCCFNYGYEKSHIPPLQLHSSAHIKALRKCGCPYCCQILLHSWLSVLCLLCLQLVVVGRLYCSIIKQLKTLTSGYIWFSSSVGKGTTGSSFVMKTWHQIILGPFSVTTMTLLLASMMLSTVYCVLVLSWWRMWQTRKAGRANCI